MANPQALVIIIINLGKLLFGYGYDENFDYFEEPIFLTNYLSQSFYNDYLIN